MAQRRPSPSSRMVLASTPPHSSRRKYPLRRSPPLYKRSQTSRSSSLRATGASTRDSRPVLVPLHPNLRRLPSRARLFSQDDDEDMRDSSLRTSVKAGTKRKHVATNENAHSGGRSQRGTGRSKKLKASSGNAVMYSSDEDEDSAVEMDVESRTAWSEDEDEEEEFEEDDSTDDFLINIAQPTHLQRLRKDELIRLYNLAGLSDDAETLTKSELVDAIVTARDDLASLPPSSPRGDGNSSEYSSDEGVPAESDDEVPTPVTPVKSFPRGQNMSLRRRATTNDIDPRSSRSRPNKGRSASMGQVLATNSSSSSRQSSKRSNGQSSSRRSAERSSPSTSLSVSLAQTPLVNRLRSRKHSAPTEPSSASTPVATRFTFSALLGRTGKGKGKHVEFIRTLAMQTPSKTPSATKLVLIPPDESDLTELESSDADAVPQPSPRRLRSRDKDKESAKLKENSVEPEPRLNGHVKDLDSRRVTPMRKAKRNITTLREDDAEEDEESAEQGDTQEEEEVDELVSPTSMSPSTPVKGRKTPAKNRSRNRRHVTDAESDDGDDEEEEDELDQASEAGEDDDEATIAVEPRVLRNGKVVGDEDAEMDVEEDVGEEDASTEDSDNSNVQGSDEDMDAEGETDEEEQVMEDEIDLTAATAKSLVRLRRDDLVRLCETYHVEPVGTKPQLAEALLHWRDRQTYSSPSSTGTARPPSTVKRRRGRRTSEEKSATPPVLLRSHVHEDEPRTPPLTVKHKGAEPDLELDLETLGLEDREIPPDKLQKLEKIGSGGFKDVFIGKFRGRRIAISEFRGQLSAMDIKELKLLGEFDHPNIVRFLGVSIPENTKETPVMIVSELCSNGDLFDYIRNVNPPTLHKVLNIMLDIARGLEYLHLHKPSVIHRDCKSSNILITSRGVAKIADFGLAKVKQSTRSMVRSLVGTVNWQAPELWHAHPKYNHKVDGFSCACVYWEMLQWQLPEKKFPWEGMNEHAIYELVGAKRQRPSLSGLRRQWCPEIVDLIERMWAQEHQDRPAMTEVVEELQELVTRY